MKCFVDTLVFLKIFTFREPLSVLLTSTYSQRDFANRSGERLMEVGGLREKKYRFLYFPQECLLLKIFGSSEATFLFTDNGWPRLPWPAGSHASSSGKYLSESDIVMVYVDKLKKLHIEEADNPHYGKSKIIGMRQYNRFKFKKAIFYCSSLWITWRIRVLITQVAKSDVHV